MKWLLGVLVCLVNFACSFRQCIVSAERNRGGVRYIRMSSSYLDELSVFRSTDKKCLLGLSTDHWNIGTRKYKEFLAVHGMAKKLQKSGVAVVDVPLWECAHGPHYDELQKIFESFWIFDATSMDHLLLRYDLIIIPDPVLAKYMVEAYYDKEAKVEAKKAYYDKTLKMTYGALDAFPPKERYEYERIRDLRKQRWIRKFPPLATCGTETYKRLKNHAQIEYHAEGVEGFAVHLPLKLVPSKRVLLLRYKNRFEPLVQSLVMRGLNVTSAYPVTWMKRQWSPQEERLAKEVDVVYLHEEHAVLEWRERMGVREKEAVAACHDEDVARAAKAAGFRDIFFAKEQNVDGLCKTVNAAIEFAKSAEYGQRSGKKN